MAGSGDVTTGTPVERRDAPSAVRAPGSGGGAERRAAAAGGLANAGVDRDRRIGRIDTEQRHVRGVDRLGDRVAALAELRRGPPIRGGQRVDGPPVVDAPHRAESERVGAAGLRERRVCGAVGRQALLIVGVGAEGDMALRDLQAGVVGDRDGQEVREPVPVLHEAVRQGNGVRSRRRGDDLRRLDGPQVVVAGDVDAERAVGGRDVGADVEEDPSVSVVHECDRGLGREEPQRRWRGGRVGRSDGHS